MTYEDDYDKTPLPRISNLTATTPAMILRESERAKTITAKKNI